VVESSICQACSSPLVAGWAFCASCGARVSDSSPSEPVAQTEPAASAEPEPVASIEPEEAPPARTPGGYVPPSTEGEPSPWALKPSRESSGGRGPGPSMSVSVGAIPVSSLRPSTPVPDHVDTAEPVETAAGPAPASPAAPLEPDDVAAPVLPTVTIPTSSPAPPVPAPDRSARRESTSELVAFGLVAAGAVIGVASLFMPWANGGGIGIGNYATANETPPANQWGWGMPAGIPLLLLSGLVLAAITGKDRVMERLPNLAGVLGRVTDLILPMTLGGLYLGVFLLYLTLPSGYGSGVVVLFFGACLMIAGAAVSLFTNPEVPQGGK